MKEILTLAPFYTWENAGSWRVLLVQDHIAWKKYPTGPVTQWLAPLGSLISSFLLICIPIPSTDDAYLPQKCVLKWVCLPISSTDALLHALHLWMHSWGRELSLKQPLCLDQINHKCPAFVASFLILAYPAYFYPSFQCLLPVAEGLLKASIFKSRESH